MFHSSSSRFGQKDKKGNARSGSKSYIYRAKSPKRKHSQVEIAAEDVDAKKPSGSNLMANLLQNLKADGPETYKKYLGHDSESEEDEDITTIVRRRQSMNMVSKNSNVHSSIIDYFKQDLTFLSHTAIGYH